MPTGAVGVWDVDFWRLTEATGILEGFELHSDGSRVQVSEGLGWIAGHQLQGGYELDLAGQVGWLVIEAGHYGIRAGRAFAGEGLELFAVWCNGATLGAVRDLRRRLWVVEGAFCLQGGAATTALVYFGIPIMIRRVQAATLRHDDYGNAYWQTTLATVRYDGQETVRGHLRAAIQFETVPEGRAALIIEGFEMS